MLKAIGIIGPILAITAVLSGCSEGELVPTEIAPVALNASIETPLDTPVIITLEAMDHNGDELTYSIISPPLNGSLDTANLPEITYTPLPGFQGVDTLMFAANDGMLDSRPASIYIGVANSAPTASAQNLSLAEDTVLPLTLDGIDPDGDSLAWVIETLPINGTLKGTDPDLTYTPDPDYYGNDAFAFYTTDEVNSSPVVTVDISIWNINDLPSAYPQEYETYRSNPLIIELAGFDPEGTPLMYSIAISPTHGSLDTSDLPAVTYTPDPGYSGIDYFTYFVSDGTGQSLSETITITIQHDFKWQVNHTFIPAFSQIKSQMDYNGNLAVRADSISNGYGLIKATFMNKNWYYQKITMGNFESMQFIPEPYDLAVLVSPYLHQTYLNHVGSYYSQVITDNAAGYHSVTKYEACLAEWKGNAVAAYMNPPNDLLNWVEHYETRLKIVRAKWPYLPDQILLKVHDARISNECLGTDSHDNLHLMCVIGLKLYYYKFNGIEWNPAFEKIESDLPVHSLARIRVDHTGRIHALTKTTDGVYAYLHGQSGNWTVEALYGLSDNDVNEIAFDIDDEGFMHLAYTCALYTQNRSIYYRTNRSGKWQNSVVDSVRHSGTEVYEGYHSTAIIAHNNGIVDIVAAYCTTQGFEWHMVHMTNAP